MPPESESAVATEHRAANHLRDVLDHALGISPESAVLVVFDEQSELARLLTSAYRRCLPEATFVPFETTPQATILAAFELLLPGDLVVLIQSTSFRLDAFRIRIELFQRSLKVIEHPHLQRMVGEEARTYVESLAYDVDYYRSVGRGLQERLGRAREGVLCSPGERLVFDAGFEPAKVNIGDYTGMRNVGGQFPIGEVFTESRSLEAVAGRVRISFFGDTDFTVRRPSQPIVLVVEAGRVVATEDSTPAFERVLQEIREHEDQVWLRELGFGLNRAFSAERRVSDVGSFERMCGVHLSLGAKHAVYGKPEIRKRAARFHVDVFVETEEVLLDGETVFRDGAWCVGMA